MSKKKKEINLEEEEVINLNIAGDQKIDVLADGTEILRDELEEEEEDKEEISDENLRKLVEFTTGIKDISVEELEELRNNEEELERLIRISFAKSKHFTYAPKKNFGIQYKKKRQRNNRVAKKQRKLNKSNKT